MKIIVFWKTISKQADWAGPLIWRSIESHPGWIKGTLHQAGKLAGQARSSDAQLKAIYGGLKGHCISRQAGWVGPLIWCSTESHPGWRTLHQAGKLAGEALSSDIQLKAIQGGLKGYWWMIYFLAPLLGTLFFFHSYVFIYLFIENQWHSQGQRQEQGQGY